MVHRRKDSLRMSTYTLFFGYETIEIMIPPNWNCPYTLMVEKEFLSWKEISHS